ncbi:TolC family protein [Acidovorax carolinensis]|nr:TolC family protein [Acidovorax carolinensis]
MALAWPLYLVLLGAGAMASPSLAPAPGASLEELEQWALTAAPTVRLAQAEQDLAMHRTGAAGASQGARLFGGTGLSTAREAVNDSLSRDYQRFNVQLGVRWPLLGSRDAQLRSVREAELAVEQGQVRLRQARQEAVQAVRRSYVRHLRSAQRVQIAQAFLDLKPQAQAQLLHRRESGVLLEAERLKLLGLFDTVQAARDSQRALQATSLNELERLTNQPQHAIQTQPMAWPEACRSPETLRAREDQYPPIALIHLELNAWGQIAETMQRTGLEASIAVAQGFSRDIGGPNGRNTAVGVDFSMPLQWRAQRDAALGQVQSQRTRLETLLDLRRNEFQAAAEQAQAQWRLRRGEMSGHQLSLQAAQEVLRVASLRLEAFDGSGYGRMLSAHHDLYQASMQVVDGAERVDLAELDLLALAAGDCDLASPALNDGAALALTAVTSPLALTPGHTAAPKGLGWYIWNGQSLLENPSSLDALPQGSHRVLVSFTAPQLRALAQPAEQKRWAQLLAQAGARGLRLELLLGEATWVLPSQRQALLDLLAPLRALPVDGLHLDLERSQLPPADQPLWGEAVVDTLRAVRSAVDWPIALTTHYRELRAPNFTRQIHAAGVTELVAMVYVSSPARASEIARPLLQGPPGLRLAVAQSIERNLPTDESSYLLGKAQALRRWRQLSQALETLPGFSGIVVQSWDEFKKARP